MLLSKGDISTDLNGP